MEHRRFAPLDLFIGEIDKAIRVLAAPALASRPSPAPRGGEWVMEPRDRLESARLMRVNHSGEVSAQALYRGQAITARDQQVEGSMRQAAVEEMDHLAWCEQRLDELKGRTSLLNPLWYAGSFAIGALAGAIGDRWSLGFIVETERQVETHLEGHATRLPAADHRSRAVIEQMTQDEARHGDHAAAMGAKELPLVVRSLMGLTARVMTHASYWL